MKNSSEGVAASRFDGYACRCASLSVEPRGSQKQGMQIGQVYRRDQMIIALRYWRTGATINIGWTCPFAKNTRVTESCKPVTLSNEGFGQRTR